MRYRLRTFASLALLAACKGDGGTGPKREAVSSIRVTPDTASLVVGATRQMSGTPLDASGQPLAGRTIGWSSSDSSRARVDAGGLVTAVGVGSATITATSEGKTGTARVTVLPLVASPYHVEVRYLGDAPERLRSSVAAAVARWRSVIVGDLPDIPVSLAPGQCFADAPAIDEVVDDLLIYVQVVPLSGFSGFTSVCWIRTSGSLPIVAHIRINSADVSRMFSEGWGDNLVLHEMGHAVGMLDFVWTRQQLTDFTDPTNPVFVGSAAKAAFQALIGGQPAGSPVPLENTGALGTVRTHWRRSVFDGEVMAPWVYPGSVLSVLTVSALQDLGFQVDRSAAQPFRGRSGVAGAGAGVPLSEGLSGPVGTIDTRGTVVRLPRE